MKVAKAISLMAVAVLVVACGGGGDEAGDVGEMSVIPADVTWKVATCGTRYSDGITVHTINGGQPPFRINSSDPGLFEFGIYQIVGGTRQYVPLALGGDGTVELRGKDPQFVVRTKFGRGCVDPAVITILDYHSNPVSIEYVIEEEEEEAAAAS